MAQGEVIQVPNMLRMKVGGGPPLSEDVLARAEAALKSLSGQFSQWLQVEIDKLDAARAGIESEGLNAATAEAPDHSPLRLLVQAARRPRQARRGAALPDRRAYPRREGGRAGRRPGRDQSGGKGCRGRT
jgi:hypothetical protein